MYFEVGVRSQLCLACVYVTLQTLGDNADS